MKYNGRCDDERSGRFSCIVLVSTLGSDMLVCCGGSTTRDECEQALRIIAETLDDPHHPRFAVTRGNSSMPAVIVIVIRIQRNARN